MRLHSLELQAFGPFPDTVSVDFDTLSEAGLFLLSGPTGAGKTSVLDAVCFALYGDVPGDRGAARRLRCDTAPEGRQPRVVLEVTLSGRRFRLTRSPQWVRPKRRGAGTTTEQAHVVCEERIGGDWVALSNRLDETGHLIAGLLGMNLAQFCQVAMLPQGQFQGFLRARSEERHTLLQRLFATTRFEQIERWLREHARDLGRQSREHEQELGRWFSRLHEASGDTPPDEWAEHTWAELADQSVISGWISGRATAANTTAEAMAADLVAARGAQEQAAAAALEARATVALRARGEHASAELSALEANAADQAARSVALAESRRAAPVLPLHRLATSARQAAESADHRAHRAAAHAWDALAGWEDTLAIAAPDDALTADFLQARLAPIGDQVARARALLPEAAEQREVTVALAEQRRHAIEVDAALARARSSHLAVPEQIATLDAQLSEARTRAATQVLLNARVVDLEDASAAQHRLVRQEAGVAQAHAAVTAAITRVQTQKESWLELREARINGIAAELAADLAVGANCPVCGSDDHPHPAAEAAGAPTVQQEKAARVLVDDAEFEQLQAEAELRALRDDVTALRVRAGDLSPEALAALLAQTRDDLRVATEAAGLLPRREAELAALQRSLADAQRVEANLEADLAAVSAQIAGLGQRSADLRFRLTAALAGTSFSELTPLVEAGDALLATGREAVEALVASEQAGKAVVAADAAVQECLTEQRFTTIDAALRAVLDPDATDTLEERIRDHERREHLARTTLADPGVTAALAAESPDLITLDAEERRTSQVADSLRVAAADAARRAERLVALCSDLDVLLGAWRPIRERHDVAAELAAFLEGKSGDNELRMRLSAYVLAWRLSQVVAAANERLMRMSGARYVLEHTGRRGSGETRGGLSLLVRDEWSGEARDPATLSGGETFVVSLALALGLADVVAHEVGGSQLDTLFVDEGFGSLDQETLDDVMDTLDALREGGRVVGVVSHVAEMRSRIPTQLLVGKDRAGSTIGIARGTN